jgi:LCP family protein required for cell wall assembly
MVIYGSEPPKPPGRKGRRKRHRLPRWARWTLAVLGLVLVAVLGAGGYELWYLNNVYNKVTKLHGTDKKASKHLVATIPTSSQPITALLIGSDHRGDGATGQNGLSDTLMLARLDPAHHMVSLLSIPRDLWVPIAGQRGVGKIDTAYQTGGVDAAIATVQQNFQVHIDDYVWIGLKGLIKLIDTMGGVNLVVTNPVMDDFYPADINTSSPYGYYRVALLPGPVHLDGVHALQYVRSRHGDLRGDFARSERQQELLLALKAQAKHLNIANLPDLAGAMNGEVKTSISLQRMRELFSVLDHYNASGVHRVLLNAPYTSEGFASGQSVVFADWGLVLPLVHESFPR